MTKRDAYRIVYNDILNRDMKMFLGSFDAVNGTDDFIFGVATVMEFIALESSEADCDSYQKIFSDNFQKSVDRAKEIRYNIKRKGEVNRNEM